MEKKISKTGNWEKFEGYAMVPEELKKVKGGGEDIEGQWVFINGVLVWVPS